MSPVTILAENDNPEPGVPDQYERVQGEASTLTLLHAALRPVTLYRRGARRGAGYVGKGCAESLVSAAHPGQGQVLPHRGGGMALRYSSA